MAPHLSTNVFPNVLILPPVKTLPSVFNLGPRLSYPYDSYIDTVEGFFNYFFDDQLLRKIVGYTNQRIEVEEENITINELRGFIGLLIIFGVTKKNDVEINDIWSYDSINHMDIASACMTRER